MLVERSGVRLSGGVRCTCHILRPTDSGHSVVVAMSETLRQLTPEQLLSWTEIDAARRRREYDVAKLPGLRSSDTPVWMSEAASGDLLGIFMLAPAVLRFLLGHPESRPDLQPDALDAAGLLEHRDGKRVAITYARNATRPYGPDGLRRDS
jgi:hypothetical protein